MMRSWMMHRYHHEEVAAISFITGPRVLIIMLCHGYTRYQITLLKQSMIHYSASNHHSPQRPRSTQDLPPSNSTAPSTTLPPLRPSPYLTILLIVLTHSLIPHRPFILSPLHERNLPRMLALDPAKNTSIAENIARARSRRCRDGRKTDRTQFATVRRRHSENLLACTRRHGSASSRRLRRARWRRRRIVRCALLVG